MSRGRLARHPKREHCKAHYKRVKKHKHTLCVHVAPPKPAAAAPGPLAAAAPTPPTPPVLSSAPAAVVPPAPAPPVVETPAEPIKPAGPLATITTLKLTEPEECHLESIGGGIGSVDSCLYTVAGSTTGSDGTPLTSPTPVFVFTNPAKPGAEWTVSGLASFRLRVAVERVGSVVETSLSGPVVGLIGTVPGEEYWSVAAAYAGSTGWSASRSPAHTLSP
jgi:hypothetical protein